MAQFAVELADRYHLSKQHVWTAAWFHDVTKEMTPKQFIEQQIPHSSYLDELYRDYPKVWHAFSAPVYIKEKLGITNVDIAHAIQWHTTGRANMSDIEKVIYLADFSEPGRKGEAAQVVRELLRKDLDESLKYAIIHLIKELKDKQAKIHPESLNCYRFYNDYEFD